MAEMTAETSSGQWGVNRRRRFRLNAWRAVVLVVFGAFFLTPIGAMLEFSTRGLGAGAGRTLSAWQSIVAYPDLTAAILVSLELAAITSVAMLVLLVPTMIWVRLRLPRIQRAVEFLCLLPRPSTSGSPRSSATRP